MYREMTPHPQPHLVKSTPILGGGGGDEHSVTKAEQCFCWVSAFNVLPQVLAALTWSFAMHLKITEADGFVGNCQVDLCSNPVQCLLSQGQRQQPTDKFNDRTRGGGGATHAEPI